MALRILSVIFLLKSKACLVLTLILIHVLIHCCRSHSMVQSIRTQLITLYTKFRTLVILELAGIVLLTMTIASPADALPDPYIAQYLKVQPDEVAVMAKNDSGITQNFDYATLVKGKELFSQNCQSCHVGGATLTRPELPLSLIALQGATPPRTTIDALVAYMRYPLGYNGEDDNYSCREIKKTWLNDSEVEAIAGFVLRAAEKAAGWGTSDLF